MEVEILLIFSEKIKDCNKQLEMAPKKKLQFDASTNF
jgi:hypothetical protein